MGYYEYLRDIMHPLGIYDLETGSGSDELRTEGAALDKAFDMLEKVELEAFLSTAVDYGLDMYEEIVPSRPISKTLEDRREALAALLRIDGCGFTEEALNTTLIGCGVAAFVSELEKPGKLEVSFPGTWGVPDNFEMLQERIEQILPCHLEIIYAFNYLSWIELSQLCSSWSGLEETFSNWKNLESGSSLC